MNLPQTLKSPRTWAAIALHIGAAVVGWQAGYDFGSRVGGQLGGVVTALCASVFCSLLAEGPITRWVMRSRR